MQNFKRSIMSLLKALLPASAAVIFLETLWLFYGGLTRFYYKGFILLAVVYGALFILFLKMYGGNKVSTERLRNLILSDAIALVFSNVFIYIIMSLIALGFFNPLALIVSAFVQLIACALLNMVILRIGRLMFPKKSAVAVISDSVYDSDAIENMRRHDKLYNIAAVLKPVDEKLFEEIGKYSVVIIGDVEKTLRGAILTQCYNTGKTVIIIPSVQDILLNSSTQYIVGDKLFYYDRYEGFSAEAAVVKRLFDIVLSLIGIILTSPIMAVVAVLIKAYDKGPAFFRQKRLTKGGKEFTIIKFRSMIENAEKTGGTYLVLDGDDRITPIGKFIRATRLDELPQFFNILKGDMSFVGPRPERPELYEIYCENCPEFRYRLKVKAGLTGYAQAYGKYNTSAEDKVKLDLLYIEKASVLQDLQILLYTIKIIFVKESTEGIKEVDKAAKKTEQE